MQTNDCGGPAVQIRACGQRSEPGTRQTFVVPRVFFGGVLLLLHVAVSAVVVDVAAAAAAGAAAATDDIHDKHKQVPPHGQRPSRGWGC